LEKDSVSSCFLNAYRIEKTFTMISFKFLRNKYVIALMVLAGLFFLIGGPLIRKAHMDRVYASPKKYCYFSHNGVTGMVFIISSLRHRDALLAHMKYEYGDSNGDRYINFPLKTLAEGSPVYVLGYTEDSLLADVVCLMDRGPYFGGDYTRGWVYAATLHDSLPPGFGQD
jgi:hypothetical protein